MLLLLVHFIDEAKEGSPINNFPSSIKVFLMHDKNLTPASHGKGFFSPEKGNKLLEFALTGKLYPLLSVSNNPHFQRCVCL
jgi:hypothetical protein